MSLSRSNTPGRDPQKEPSTPRRDSPFQRETQSSQFLRTPGPFGTPPLFNYSRTEPRNRQPVLRQSFSEEMTLSPTGSQRLEGDLANISLQLRQRNGDLSGFAESPGSTNNYNIYSPGSDRGNNDAPGMHSPSAKPPQIPSDLSPQLEAPEPRLVLSKLVLENFKSYAGRQEIGPFNASFSAVVGPNGSGKSNVIDSLLFVFGFRANKMRHGKLTNLIHKSETFPNLQSCRVEVHFEHVLDRPGVGIPFRIANSELVVARNVSFASGSTYDVNGKRSSYGEVTTLLKDKGIDLEHKRFLILQGEVESIAMMKPKAEAGGEDGLLEYLEDIIDTSKFKPLIEEAEAEVEGLREGLVEIQSRYDISVKSLEALEERRVQIEKFMQDSNEIIIRQSSLLQHEQYRFKIQQHEEQSGVAVFQAKLDQELSRSKSAREDLQALEVEIREKSKELKAASESLDEARKAAKSYKVKTAQLEEKEGQLATRSKKLEGTITTAERDLSMAETWLNNYDEDNAALTAKIEETSKSLDVECQKLAVIQTSLKERTAEISAQIEVLQVQAEPWRSQIQDLETELKRVDADVEHINKTRNEDKTRYDTIIARAKAVAERGNLEDKALKKLNSAQKQIEEQLANIEPELALATKTQILAQTKAESQRSSVMAARESRNSSQNQSRLLTELMRLRDKGEIKGLYGRLGSLGSIDPKYDIAVSTAAPGLDDLVVDTVETGQRCIQILRERNLGRAKFILLDKLTRQNISPIQTPENVPRLFDLIKPRDPKFAPAFYSVLQNTLVATSMEQARRVAYGQRRFRTVTLQGAIVEVSGAMSGGGRAASGRMAARSVEAVTLDELTGLERASAAADMELAEANQTVERLQQQSRTLNEEKLKLATEIMKQNMTVDECEAQLKELKSQRNDLKASIASRAESDDAHLKEAESKRSDIESSRSQLIEQSAPVEAQLEQLQQQILDAGGLELRIQQSRVSDLRTQAETLNERQESSARQKKASIQKVKKLEMSLSESRTELKSVAAQLVEQKALLEGRAAETRKLEDAEEKAYSVFAEIQAFLEDGKDKLTGLQAANEESLSAIKEYERGLQASQAKLAGIQSKMEEINAEISTLRLYDVREARDLRKDNTFNTGISGSIDSNCDGEAVDHPMDAETAGDSEPNGSNDESMDIAHSKRVSDLDTGEPDQLRQLSSQELEQLNVVRVQEEIKLLEERIAAVNFNMEDLVEYRAKYAEYSVRVAALNMAMKEFEAKKQVVSSLKQRRLDDFATGFDIITRKLKQMYKMITLTGNADLELVDSLDPFSEGISFSVMPPGKSWKNISNLSGGEKTLSSLALVFALHHYRPTPLYFMDEIDAALDFRNVSIIANYIKERTTKGQFIVISLRNNMFELADRLVGIYKVNSMTRSVTLDLLAESEKIVTLDEEGEAEPETPILPSSPPKIAPFN